MLQPAPAQRPEPLPQDATPDHGVVQKLGAGVPSNADPKLQAMQRSPCLPCLITKPHNYSRDDSWLSLQPPVSRRGNRGPLGRRHWGEQRGIAHGSAYKAQRPWPVHLSILGGPRLGKLSLPCCSLRTAHWSASKSHSLPFKQPTPNSTHFCWEASAKASCFSREMPNRSATFSEVILEDKQQTAVRPGCPGLARW